MRPETGPSPTHVEGAPSDADRGVGEDVGPDVLAPERDEVLRPPALRRTHLEHAHPGPHVTLEQDRERVLVRAPGSVVPAEVTAKVRQVRVDPLPPPRSSPPPGPLPPTPHP